MRVSLVAAEMKRSDSWYFPSVQFKAPVEANYRSGVSHRRGNVVEGADLAGFLCPGAHYRH